MDENVALIYQPTIIEGEVARYYYLPLINMRIELRKYGVTLSDHEPYCGPNFCTHGVSLHWSTPRFYIHNDRHPMRPNNLIQIALGPLVFSCFYPRHGVNNA